MTSILAIDPGSTRSGWVLLAGDTLLGAADEDNETIIARIRSGELRPYGPAAAVVIERIVAWGGVPQPQALESMRWTGMFTEAVRPLPVHLVRPADVTRTLGIPHQAKAKVDSAVRAYLIDRWGGGSPRRNGHPLRSVTGDAWRALAVAVAWQETREADR